MKRILRLVFGSLLRLVIFVAVAAVLVIGARKAVARKKAKMAKAPVYGMRPLPVHVAKVGEGALEQTLDYLSVVEPIREARISARLTAVINEVRVDEGDRVKKGDVLIVLDDREIREDIAAVEAQIAQASADLAANEATVEALKHSVAYWDHEAERDKKLASQDVIPEAQAEGTADKASEARGKLAAAKQKSLALGHLVEAQRRRKAVLETKLSYCRITSPYDGGIRHRYVDPGDLASPGKALLVAADRSGIKLAFDIPQEDLSKVHVKQRIRVNAPAGPREVVLTHLDPSLNAARMLHAEAEVGSAARDGLVCGQYVPISLIVGRRAKTAKVPAASVIEMPGKEPYIYLVKDGRLKRTPIRIVGASGDDIAAEGVAPGDLVVTTSFLGWARLADGMTVEVVE